MYLITIEGGDGSGKGIAARVVCDILEREKSFTAAVLTAEPRRKHPLGRSAINAVKEKKHTPEHEAKLFALDRLDHGLNWIRTQQPQSAHQPQMGDYASQNLLLVVQ